jgi:hypothetical protein
MSSMIQSSQTAPMTEKGTASNTTPALVAERVFGTAGRRSGRG